MTSERLLQGLKLIQDRYPSSTVTGIQFASSLGTRFNYQLNGILQWLFIDLSDRMH